MSTQLAHLGKKEKKKKKLDQHSSFQPPER